MFSQNQILKTGHFVLVALLAIVGLGLLVTNVHAQIAEEPDSAESPRRQTTEGELAEMMRIRETIGGSIFQEAEGLGLGLDRTEIDNEYLGEAKRLFQEQNEQEELNRLRAELANTRRSVWGEASQRSRPFLVDSSEKVKAFREVARDLERAAWQLEEVGAYDAGDSLRAQANELRQNARAFKD